MIYGQCLQEAFNNQRGIVNDNNIFDYNDFMYEMVECERDFYQSLTESYIINEAAGDKIKSIANRIVEFIKTIVEKIRKVFSTVINWFKEKLGKKNKDTLPGEGKVQTVKERIIEKINDSNDKIKELEEEISDLKSELEEEKKNTKEYRDKYHKEKNEALDQYLKDHDKYMNVSDERHKTAMENIDLKSSNGRLERKVDNLQRELDSYKDIVEDYRERMKFLDASGLTGVLLGSMTEEDFLTKSKLDYIDFFKLNKTYTYLIIKDSAPTLKDFSSITSKWTAKYILDRIYSALPTNVDRSTDRISYDNIVKEAINPIKYEIIKDLDNLGYKRGIDGRKDRNEILSKFVEKHKLGKGGESKLSSSAYKKIVEYSKSDFLKRTLSNLDKMDNDIEEYYESEIKYLNSEAFANRFNNDDYAEVLVYDQVNNLLGFIYGVIGNYTGSYLTCYQNVTNSISIFARNLKSEVEAAVKLRDDRYMSTSRKPYSEK